jgi:hypothetical protein
MKRFQPEFRMALGAITATAIYLGVSAGIARAQVTSPQTPPPAPTVVQAAPAPAVPPATSPPGSGTYAPGPASAAHSGGLEYGVAEVVKMYQGGISKDIIINYINSSALPYHLTADQIIQMQTMGLPEEITKAMIMRDGQLQAQRAQYYAQMQQQQMQQQAMAGPNGAPPEAPDASGAQVATPSTPPPTVTVIGADQPGTVVDYGYPYYYGGWPYYGYYGGPWVVGGWGWGGGWGRGGYGGWHGGGGRGGFGGHGGGGGHR